ncbi:VWA domain-containing protein [Candidatus Poribacteria bacterium]|nr:VWA domain-containing protein [Candidatus Poribacteria bacterium]
MLIRRLLTLITFLLLLFVSMGYTQEEAGMSILDSESTDLNTNITSLNPQNFPFIYMNSSVDMSGQEVTDLEQSNFRVYENGTLQTEYFEVSPPGTSGGSRLTDIVFLMDNSGSMRDEQNDVRNNVIDFVDSLKLKGVDFALGLCRFGYPAIIEDNGTLTPDADYFKNDVWNRNTLNQAGKEVGWDALYNSASQFNFRTGSQKIFILITDETPTGYNNIGDYNQNETISILQSNSITTFSLINLNDEYAVSDYGVISEQTNGQYFDIYSSFDEILNYISSGVTSTYLIRYKSSNPIFNGTLRNVEVAIDYQGYQSSAQGSYIPGAEPRIQRTQQTLDLHNQLWGAGTDFTIEVEINDDVSPYTQRATLYHKNTSASDYQALSMNSFSGNLWSGTIAGSSVNSPGVDYYITASDGQSTASNPSMIHQNKPHQLAILPNVAPQITHIPVTTAQAGKTVLISADILDNTNQLDILKLFYRKTGQLLYQSVDMILDSVYKAEIPDNYVTFDGLEYYIFAQDDLGVANYDGTADYPHSISVFSDFTFIHITDVHIGWDAREPIVDLYNSDAITTVSEVMEQRMFLTSIIRIREPSIKPMVIPQDF